VEQKNVLLIVPNSELQMTGHNTLLLVITSGVTSQLQDLGSEVLENGSKVN